MQTVQNTSEETNWNSEKSGFLFSTFHQWSLKCGCPGVQANDLHLAHSKINLPQNKTIFTSSVSFGLLYYAVGILFSLRAWMQKAEKWKRIKTLHSIRFIRKVSPKIPNTMVWEKRLKLSTSAPFCIGHISPNTYTNAK